MSVELQSYQKIRSKLHRLHDSLAIRTSEELVDFVLERRIATATARVGVAVLANAIAGRELSGSWMAAPECEVIYARLKSLDSQELARARLIDGKESVFDNEVAAAVERCAGDVDRRQQAQARLSKSAKILLKMVESAGSVRSDEGLLPTTEMRKARNELERELLVDTTTTHTDMGHHAAIMRPWRLSRVAAVFSAAAREYSFQQAHVLLLHAAMRSAVLAEERVVRRWFCFSEDVVSTLIEYGIAKRIRSKRKCFLSYRDQ